MLFRRWMREARRWLRRERGGLLERVPPRARHGVRRAYRMLVMGDALGAAQLFGALADQADQRSAPVYAAAMRMSAALAEAKGGAASRAVEGARRALDEFVRAGQAARAAPAAERVATALRRRGYQSEAAQIDQAVEEVLREIGAVGLAGGVGRRGQLPPKCGSCGGPLFPDEVEWSDATTACCPYCGSVLKTMT